MSIDASPPQKPPQMSPDGQWVWDGREWQPVGTHKSVFPSWNSIRVEPAVQVAPVVELAREPVMSYPVAYAPPEPVTKLWEEGKTTSYDKYLYAGAAVVVLIMAMIFINSLGVISFPWSSTDSRPVPSPTLPPLATRTDYARADRFVNSSLLPAATALNQTMPILTETCNGLMTVSCQSAIVATEKQTKSVLAAIDREPLPGCIAAPVGKLRADLAGMDAGLKLSLKGYAENSNPEVTQGLAQYANAGQPYQADVRAVAPAETKCGTEQTGP